MGLENVNMRRTPFVNESVRDEGTLCFWEYKRLFWALEKCGAPPFTVEKWDNCMHFRVTAC